MDTDKYMSYLPLSELPYIKQLARMIYLNTQANGYNNTINNQLYKMLRYGNLDRYYNNNWR